MLFMEKLMHKIAYVGDPFQEDSKDADDDRILLEGVHNHDGC